MKYGDYSFLDMRLQESELAGKQANLWSRPVFLLRMGDSKLAIKVSHLAG
jgi:hypothetical protein